MKLYALLLWLLLIPPVQASNGTVLGMLLTIGFTVIMLVLFLLIVVDVGNKKK